MNQITSRSRPRPPAITAAAALILLLAVGAALLAVGHLGIEVPVLSALGPGGSRVVLVAGISFAMAAVISTVIGFGLLRLRRWAWGAAIALSTFFVFAGIGQYRGLASAVGILLSLAVLVLLWTTQARDALGYRRDSQG